MPSDITAGMEVMMGVVASKAELAKSDNTDTSYKLSDKDIEKIKSDIQSRPKLDLMLLSGKAAEDIEEISTGKVKIISNYPGDEFFTKAPPDVSVDGKYTVNGAEFTKAELEQCRKVMQAAVASIGAGVGKNITLDYKNYAQMGIAYSTVKAYAKSNLSEVQSNAVISAMEKYNQNLITMQERLLLDENGFAASPYTGLSDYYGIVKKFGTEELAAVNNLIDEMNRVSGGDKNHITEDFISTVQSATNKGLTDSIFSLFSGLDASNPSAVKSATDKYRELVTPAYTAYGISNTHGNLDKVINSDIAEFMLQISTVSAYAKYSGFNVTA